MLTQVPATPLRHYLQFTDLNAEEYAHVFKRASFIKAKFKAYEKYQPLTECYDNRNSGIFHRIIF